MTIVKCYTRVVSTTVSKIFMLANTEIFIFAYGHEFRQFLRMTHILVAFPEGKCSSIERVLAHSNIHKKYDNI